MSILTSAPNNYNGLQWETPTQILQFSAITLEASTREHPQNSMMCAYTLEFFTLSRGFD